MQGVNAPKGLLHCLIHNQIALLHLAEGQVQPPGLQAHTCPHQVQKEGQGPKKLCHFHSISIQSSSSLPQSLSLAVLWPHWHFATLQPKPVQLLHRESTNTWVFVKFQFYLPGFGKWYAFLFKLFLFFIIMMGFLLSLDLLGFWTLSNPFPRLDSSCLWSPFLSAIVHALY